MDFPGGSITNFHVIDGFSNIHWRILTEENGETPTKLNGHTILKHLSRQKELELQLRNLDCLVSSFPKGQGVWVFSATPDFEGLGPLYANEGNEERRLLVGSTIFKVIKSGCTASADLIKNLTAESNNASPGSVRSQFAQSRRDFAYQLYSAFMSAATGTLSLQLIRRNNGIPLGSRSFFFAVERDSYGSTNIINDDLASDSTITSLYVQLTPVGKITVSLQTTAQGGITRLCRPDESSIDFDDTPPGTDLWLSPTGSVARLISSNPEQNIESTPFSTTGAPGNGHFGPTNHSQWKCAVLEWLKSSGLPVKAPDEMAWVEIELWEPMYSRFTGQSWRVGENNSPTLPLKRILWPAMYCFKRTKSNISNIPNAFGDALTVENDPLVFAEKWRSMDIPQQDEAGSKPLAGDTQPSAKEQEATPGVNDFLEGIESLSRASQYPEAQTASLVYPTPPDGATAVGLNPPGSSEVFLEESDGMTSAVPTQDNLKPSIQPRIHDPSDPDLTMDFGPSAGLTVGSGLYDTNDDDDLFGDMNERDFGSKGITDADFSFFDDPDFDHLAGGVPTNNPQDMTGLEMGPLEPPSSVLEQPLSEPTPTEKTPVKQIETPKMNFAEQPTEPQVEPAAPKGTNSLSSPQAGNSQTISPPLSPVEIKKIILPSTNGEPLPIKKGQGMDHYKPVAFKQDMAGWDRKYGADGKFGFMAAGTDATKNPEHSAGEIPTIGLPRRSKSYASGYAPQKSAEQGKLLDDIELDDSSSDESDQSDQSTSESESSQAAVLIRKRKRARSNSPSTSVAYQDKLPADVGKEATAYKAEDFIYLGNLFSALSDWSMMGFFSFSDNHLAPVLARRDLQVQVAQLLVDQVTQSSLNHIVDGRFALCDFENKTCSLRTFFEDTAVMGGIERLDLNSLVSLQESNNYSSPTSNGMVPRHSSQRKEAGRGIISKLQSPHVRIRRGKDYLEALPAAVSFWETFGLEPAYGPKDVTAYCIHPEFAQDAASSFLKRLGLAYSSCNLGSHTCGTQSNWFPFGLGSWELDVTKESYYESAMDYLNWLCKELGANLLNGVQSKSNVVLYIINPFSHATAMVDICTAFWNMFRSYVADMDKQQAGRLDELVLQIVPMDFIMSADSLVVPPQAQYLSLALEVYSRCPPKPAQSSSLDCAPPVLLADPVPKSINFRLHPEKFSPLQEGKSLHLAVSKSQDNHWISVAWSDNSGSLQQTMSYGLQFRGSSAYRTVADVQGEIWIATKDILDKVQARWKIMLVHTNPVDEDEAKTWLKYVEQYNKTSSVPLELAIFIVDVTPDLSLEPPALPIPMNVINSQPSTTPVATPNPGNILSPEQSTNAPTPPGANTVPASAPTPTESSFEADESLLTDICDESWSVIPSHRLNSSPQVTEFRPALASGYLLRRKGTTDGDGAYAMGVYLIYTPRPPHSHESLLRESLTMYRDLATLARVRGTLTVQRNTMPWHIATAVRAQEILSFVL